MTWLSAHWPWLAALACLTLAAILSALHTLRDRRHLPVALVLGYGVLADVAREAIGAMVLRPERARLLALVGGVEVLRPPFAGCVRVWLHVEQALHLGWPAAVAWFALRAVQTTKRTRPLRIESFVMPLWLAVSVAVAALYPEMSGTVTARWPLAPVYAVCETASAMVCGAAFLGLLWRGEMPQLRHAVVLTLGTTELLVVGAGPYAWNPWTDWPMAQILYGAAGLVIVWRTVVTWRRPTAGFAA